MTIVLEIIKRYLFEIGCGAGAVLGLALSALFLGSMSDVAKEMEEADRLRGRIASMSRGSDLANEKAVQRAQQRIDKIKAGYGEVLAFARKLNWREPLTKTVFPNSRIPDEGVAFRKAYQKEVAGWLGILHAGDVPTSDDIAQERDRMEAEKPPDTSLGADRPSTDKGETGEAKRDPYNNPEVRAAIRRARGIYCYATVRSFQESDISKSDGPMYAVRPPTLEEMWYAQLEVWLQRDIIEAIAAVNNAAAEQLKARAAQAASESEKAKLQPWVGNLPIKEVVSIQMTYYLTDQQTKAVEGARSEKGRAYPPASVDASFTGNRPNELYELLQFTVKLVVDAREIPAVVAGLSRNGFHAPIRIAYEAVPPDPAMQDRIYGDVPVVALVVDFETVYLSELYVPLMPDKILELLGKQRPEPEPAEGA